MWCQNIDKRSAKTELYDEHRPPNARVILSFANFDEFADI